MAKAASEKADSKVEYVPPPEGVALNADEQREYQRTLWRERMFSLWAPVTIFGAIFALYIVLIELHTPAYLWAQPVMKAIGLLALIAFFGLLLARSLYKPFGRLRQARHFTHEVLGELNAGLDNKALSEARIKTGQHHRWHLMRLYGQPDAVKLASAAESASKFTETELGRKRFGSDFFIGFVKAFAIAMAIRTVIIEPFKIPSGSMIPTLEIGDQIFVNKFIYGVRIPYMNKVPFQIIRAPERGDVIVFNNPRETDKDYVKRIVGIGGDRIKIIGDVVHINDVPQARTLVADNYVYKDQRGSEWFGQSARLYTENLAGHEHPTLEDSDGTIGDGRPSVYIPNDSETPEFTVPEGTVFVMGDNRDNSSDGRYGMGEQGAGNKLVFVPLGNIKGKAMVVWLALGFGGVGDGFFGGTGFRTDRLFKPVR